MPYRAALWISVLAGTLAAQNGTTPKASAPEYPVQANQEKLSIGAEYLGHSFSSGRDMYIAKDYLVVEVALYPASGEKVQVNAADFSLRVNGRKPALKPQQPEIVAQSLNHPDSNSGFHSVEQLGPVTLGQPRQTERFPGDPNAQTQPAPPTTDTSSGVEKQPHLKAEELVVEAALPNGEHHGPTSGFLYFYYRGKMGHIRSLELVYSGAAGSSTMSMLGAGQ